MQRVRCRMEKRFYDAVGRRAARTAYAAWLTMLIRATGVDTDAVNAILSRLNERGLVRHKRPYWAVEDDEERFQSAYWLRRHQRTGRRAVRSGSPEERRTDERASTVTAFEELTRGDIVGMGDPVSEENLPFRKGALEPILCCQTTRLIISVRSRLPR